LIQEGVAVVPGTDGRKMSKSYGNTIPLFAKREEIQKIVMGIETDSKTDKGHHLSQDQMMEVTFAQNVYGIHSLFRKEAELIPLYFENANNYKKLKESLIDDIDSFVKPLRERRESIEKDLDSVHQVLKNGAERARSLAMRKMHEVREKVGLTI